MSESNVILKVDAIETYYGQICALRDVSFEVHDKQIVTLLGGNGAGKSTTLKTISNIEPCRVGKITFFGEDITTMPPHKIVELGLIHIPEGRRIFKDLTVRENLELGGFTRRGDDKKRDLMIDEVFCRFPRLRERHAQLGGTLSGGEQQMLAVGRGLMAEPKLLMLDEPSMGLAPLLVAEIASIIRDLNNEGIPILLVEQNSKMALGLADYGYVLETGEITLEGPASELIKDPKVVKAYLGIE
ncbi:MAG TPA: ABC transporter ATP-binding protein [Clostridiaceae bacterium]|nr:ABC transporter ATP-binding protein [Clostridiaceae bacterium]